MPVMLTTTAIAAATSRIPMLTMNTLTTVTQPALVTVPSLAVKAFSPSPHTHPMMRDTMVRPAVNRVIFPPGTPVVAAG